MQQALAAARSGCNLDEVSAFKGRDHHDQFLCGHIWSQLRDAAKTTGLGDNGRLCAKSRHAAREPCGTLWYEANASEVGFSVVGWPKDLNACTPAMREFLLSFGGW
jgi:hypothetical protein